MNRPAKYSFIPPPEFSSQEASTQAHLEQGDAGRRNTAPKQKASPEILLQAASQKGLLDAKADAAVGTKVFFASDATALAESQSLKDAARTDADEKISLFLSDA